MIVKVVRNGVESFYECRRARVYLEKGTPTFTVDMESDNISLECEKATTEVYIMNDQGKTIQKYDLSWEVVKT